MQTGTAAQAMSRSPKLTDRALYDVARCGHVDQIGDERGEREDEEQREDEGGKGANRKEREGLHARILVKSAADRCDARAVYHVHFRAPVVASRVIANNAGARGPDDRR